jgi:hypothetical protein
MNMYVSNLGFHVTDEDLRKLFADFGVVDSAKVIMDRMTNQSRGFGFVEMQNDTKLKQQCKSWLVRKSKAEAFLYLRQSLRQIASRITAIQGGN